MRRDFGRPHKRQYCTLWDKGHPTRGRVKKLLEEYAPSFSVKSGDQAVRRDCIACLIICARIIGQDLIGELGGEHQRLDSE